MLIDSVPGLSLPNAKDDQKVEALPPNVETAVIGQVKSSSWFNQLQDKMKQGKLGPKISGDNG